MINDYGTEDPRYKNSYNELTATFCMRVYTNIMPMVMEVLETMRKKYYTEKTVCLSHGPVDLFRLLSQITEMYKFCRAKIVWVSMLGLAYK